MPYTVRQMLLKRVFVESVICTRFRTTMVSRAVQNLSKLRKPKDEAEIYYDELQTLPVWVSFTSRRSDPSHDC